MNIFFGCSQAPQGEGAGARERVGSGLRAGAGPACPRAPGGEGRGGMGGREGGKEAGGGLGWGRGEGAPCAAEGAAAAAAAAGGRAGGKEGGERARLSCCLAHPGGIVQNLSSEIHGEMANRIDGFHTLLARQSRSLP